MESELLETADSIRSADERQLVLGQHPLHFFKGICGGCAEDTLCGEVSSYWWPTKL